jgi:hypothetical protein
MNAEMIFDETRFMEWFRGNVANFTIGHGFVDYLTVEDVEPTEPRPLVWRIPDFQRPVVWTEAQCVRFIESIWGGLPIPAYVYDQEQRGEWRKTLLDGQQRWYAIGQYVDGAFPVHGAFWKDIPEGWRRRFANTPFSAYVTYDASLEEQKEIYDRLAYGGTPHPPKPAPPSS